MLNYDRELPDSPDDTDQPEPPFVEEPDWMATERLEYTEWAVKNTES